MSDTPPVQARKSQVGCLIVSILLGLILGLLFGGAYCLWQRPDEPPIDDSDLRLETSVSALPEPANLLEFFEEGMEDIQQQVDSEGRQDFWERWNNRDLEPENTPSVAEVKSIVALYEPVVPVLKDLLAADHWSWGYNPQSGTKALGFMLPIGQALRWLRGDTMLRCWLARQDNDRQAWRTSLAEVERMLDLGRGADGGLFGALLVTNLHSIYLGELEEAWIERNWRPEFEDFPSPISDELVRQAVQSEYTLMVAVLADLNHRSDGAILKEALEQGFDGLSSRLFDLGGIQPNRSHRLLAERARSELSVLATPWEKPPPTALNGLVELGPKRAFWSETLNHHNGISGFLLANNESFGGDSLGRLIAQRNLYQQMLELAAVLQTWEERRGALPESWEALVEAGWLREIPADPTGPGTISYDPSHRLLWGQGGDGDPSRTGSYPGDFKPNRLSGGNSDCPMLRIPELELTGEGE